MTTEERRRSARFDVDGVHGTFQFTLDVKVTNLSVTGMALETSARLTVGREYTFRISNDEGEVTLPGTVAWSVLGSTRRDERGNIQPVYQAGIHFGDVLTQQAQRLLRIIGNNAIVDPGERLFGRFRLRSTDALRLDSSTDFTLQKLSTSGMLVETSVMPPMNAIVSLDLELGKRRLMGTARAAFIEEITTPNGPSRARIGLEFIELTPEGHEAVTSFIASHLPPASPSAE